MDQMNKGVLHVCMQSVFPFCKPLFSLRLHNRLSRGEKHWLIGDSLRENVRPGYKETQGAQNKIEMIYLCGWCLSLVDLKWICPRTKESSSIRSPNRSGMYNLRFAYLSRCFITELRETFRSQCEKLEVHMANIPLAARNGMSISGFSISNDT